MNKLDRAIIFAAQAHAGQKRKYTGLPYLTHPLEVLTILASAENVTEDMQCAAVLHDVIEDTHVVCSEIWIEFGGLVADMVLALTEMESPGNRATRKAAEARRLGGERAEVQTIKVADLISNTATIVEYDPGFAKVYLAEKMVLLNALTKADRGLRARAYRQLGDARRRLYA